MASIMSITVGSEGVERKLLSQPTKKLKAAIDVLAVMSQALPEGDAEECLSAANEVRAIVAKYTEKTEVATDETVE